MSGLSKCLKQMGLSDHEAAILRGRVDDMTDTGMEAHKAALGAVRAYIGELEDERADIVKQIEAVGGTVPAVEKPAEQKKPEPTTKGPVISDFGEKIEGARKDYAQKLEDAQKVDVADAPLSQSWPEPDYQALLDGGADPWAVGFMHAARDEIPPKPKKRWKLKGWVEQVSLLRDVTSKLISGEMSAESARTFMSDPKRSRQTAGVQERASLYQKVGHEKSLKGIRVVVGRYSFLDNQRFDPPKEIWTVESMAGVTALSNWPKIITRGDTKEEAIEGFVAQWKKAGAEEETKERTIDFQIYARRQGKDVFIGKKVGKTVVELKGGFTSSTEARKWRDANHAELVTLLEKFKELPYERRAVNASRVGADHRNGAPVTPEQFSDTFGFRGVQFGNWVENDRRQADLNKAYDALMDLAGVVGVEPKALSLNGELGLAFGARGTGGLRAAAAHYEPDRVVINLTKKAGAGSLAHEWFHAVDNYFARLGGKPAGMMTLNPKVEGVRPEMVEAFNNISRTIARDTKMIERARVLDETRTKEYWRTPEELAARAWEAYIIAKLQDQNASNDYLANIVDEAMWDAQAALLIQKENSYPYPKADEMGAIRSAFDRFLQTVETKPTNRGVAMYSLSTATKTDETPATIRASLASRFGERGIKALEDGGVLRIVASAEDLPAGLLGETEADAVYDPTNKIAYLIADRLTTAVAPAKVLHELGEHYSLQVMLGEKGWNSLAARVAELAQKKGSRAEAVWSAIKENYAEFQGRDDVELGNDVRFMHEVIAHLGETQAFRKSSIWRDIVTRVKLFLMKLGIGSISEADVGVILEGSLRRAMREQEGRLEAFSGDMHDQGAFLAAEAKKRNFSDVDQFAAEDFEGFMSAAEKWRGSHALASVAQTETPAFKRWFGDSKVVDAEVRPLVVYHGTTADFSAFDPDRAGQSFDDVDEIGMLFSSRPGEPNLMAGKVGGNVMPVYLSIKNPLVVEVPAKQALRELGAVSATSWYDNHKQEIIERSRRMGADGIIVNAVASDGYQHSTYIVFRPEQIKSAVGNAGTFDPNNPSILLSNPAPTFYSELARQVDRATMKQAPAKAWMDYINALKQKGVKPDEIAWSGVEDFLKLQEGKVSKEQVLEFLRGNGVQVQETMLGGEADEHGGNPARVRENDDGEWEVVNEQANEYIEGGFETEEDAQSAADDWWDQENRFGSADSDREQTKFSAYQLPGGENYRELLLTLPTAEPSISQLTAEPMDGGGWIVRDTTDYGKKWELDETITTAEQARQTVFNDLKREMAAPGFRSPHFAQPNILAHVRFNERTDADGKRVLFLEEVQSDWAQQGKKKGFKDESDQGALHALGEEWESLQRISRGPAITNEANERREAARGRIGEITDEMNAINDRIRDGVPKSPFVTKTEAWVGLALKRMIRYAAENGFDSISWTNGGQQESRYWDHELVLPAVQRWNELSKPDSSGEELSKNVGRELTGMSPLKVVDAAVLPALKHNQVRRAVVQAIPVDVVNVLVANGLTADKLVRDPNVISKIDSVDARSTVAAGFARATQLVGARLRATLLRILSPKSSGGDSEVLPAVRASDLSPREVMGLLASRPLSGLAGEELGGTLGAPGFSPAGSGAEASVGAAGLAGVGPKLGTTELAQFLNRHADIVSQRTGNEVEYVQPPPGEGMRAFYDRIVPNVANDVLKKLGGGKVGETKIVLESPGKYGPAVPWDKGDGSPGNYARQRAFTITPELRARALQGLPLFSRSTRIRLTIAELINAAESQESWKDWYKMHREAVENLFGDDAELFQKILSATSQLQTVKGNVTMALRAYEQMLSGKEFEGYLGVVRKNLERIREGQATAGPKISQFERANLGDESAAAVDRHVANVLFGTVKPKPQQVTAAIARIEKVAQRMGWTTRQVQAALWAFNQVKQGKAPEEVQSYDKILESRADEIAGIRSRYGRGEGGSVSPGGGARAGIAARPGSARSDQGAPLYSVPLGKVTPQQRAAATQTWSIPEVGRMDKVIRVLQDRHIDTKRVVKSILDFVGKVPDFANVYLQEELLHGRAAKAVQDFAAKELKPLLEGMALRGISMQEFEEFLHNRHAEERNQHIAKINKDMPDGGSGIDTADARAYLSALPAARRKAFESLAARVDAINNETRALIVSYGLEDQSTVDAWAGAYEHYVPLHREDMDQGHGLGTGQGISVKGPSSKRATGSRKAVVDVLANIALQRERTIARGEKNRVANALVGLAMMNPNPDFWKVDEPPKISYVDTNTNQVVRATDPMFKSRDNVIVARTPSEDGKIVEHAVIFNRIDPRAQAMATALKNLDLDEMGHVLGAVAKATRFFASMNTQYNPIFGIVNLIRDVQGAAFNLSSTALAGKQREVGRHVASALRGIYIDARAERAGKPAESSWAQLWEEFQNEGGQTGYRDMFRTSQDRAEALKDELKRVSEGKAMKFGRAVFDWLSDYNLTMENGVRLSAYRVAKESGMSNAQAASLAKNLTVNFNRKGNAATQVGAMYAFFNASVQGTARLAETLKGPAGRKIILGGLLLGSLQALAMAMAGLDDDPPEFVKERNVIIPIGGGKYLMFPMPLGLHILPNIGRVVTEWMLDGMKNTGKRTADLLGAMVEAFNPIGSAGFSLQTVTPTVVDPLAALAENKDWTGKPIARKDFSSTHPTPGHTRAKDTATWFGHSVSQALNYMSGGTAHKPGLFSPTPDQIDYLVGQVTGGLGREISKLDQTVSSAVTGERMPIYKVPLLGRFYGSAEDEASQGGQYYDNLRSIFEHKAELEGRRRAKEPTGDYLAANPDAKLVLMATVSEREVAALRRRKREMVARGARREEVERIDNAITDRMRRLNDRVRSAKQAAR